LNCKSSSRCLRQFNWTKYQNTPIVVLLSQYRCFRICRKEIFCPAESCRKTFTDMGKLVLHLRKQHAASTEATSDMIRYFIAKMLPQKIHGKVVRTTQGQDIILPMDYEGTHCH
jgi:hypothetical protein